jgi:hypothetical protein
MAFTQTDIDALKKAMALGLRSAEFRSGDTTRKQEFRSLREMEQLLARMERDIGTAAPATIYVQHSRD